MKTPERLTEWLALNREPFDTCYDPVKEYIEATFPDVSVQSGMVEVDFTHRGDRKVMVSEPIHPWHDKHLSKLVNKAASSAGQHEPPLFGGEMTYDGYLVVQGQYVATVEAHLSALTPEPVSGARKLLLSVLSIPDAFRSMFARKV